MKNIFYRKDGSRLTPFAEVRLLLVDDEASILELLQIVLKKEGFEHVFTAATGAQAIDSCRANTPHLIVLDVMLPDMEGFEYGRLHHEAV